MTNPFIGLDAINTSRKNNRSTFVASSCKIFLRSNTGPNSRVYKLWALILYGEFASLYKLVFLTREKIK